MKHWNKLWIALSLALLLLTGGVLSFVLPARAAEPDTEAAAEREKDWGTAVSGAAYGSDGTLYPYSCALYFTEGVDMNGSHNYYMVGSTFNLQCDSAAPVIAGSLNQLEAEIYIPELDITVTRSSVVGGTGKPDCYSRNGVISEVEYEGKVYIGEVVSVVSKYFLNGRLIQVLTWTKDA